MKTFKDFISEMGSRKVNKKFMTTVKNLKDFDPATYIKNNQLMPGSGIDKKLPPKGGA